MIKERFRSENLVMLMIDVQEKLVPTMKEKDILIKNSKLLLELSNRFSIPLIYTEQYPRGLDETHNDLKSYLSKSTKFEKVNFSAFTDEMEKSLQNFKKKDIILFGIESHVCVYQTVRDLINHGYNVYLVLDAIYSREQTNKDTSIKLMEKMGVNSITTEMIMFDLLEKAGSDLFKYFSKLIK